MKSTKLYPFLELNLSLILMSTSGILGNVIPLAPALIIFLRCLIGAGLLYVFLIVVGHGLKVNFKKDWNFLIGNGILLSAHWILYFYSLKISGVAVGMLSLFTYPVITTLLEPWFFSGKLSSLNIATALMVIVGIAFIVPDFDLNNQVTLGAAIGIVSAIVYSLRNLWNKKYILQYSGSKIMFYQMLVAAIFLLPTLFVYDLTLDAKGWGLVFMLALITTTIAHTLFVQALKHFTTSAVSVMSSLIPVYGILWAVLFLDEQLNSNIWIGGIIIVSTVALQSISQYGKAD
ncbi:MAG: DMT family transporter [Cyclobacteriaceae bacterium]